jgi:hypothetical protein
MTATEIFNKLREALDESEVPYFVTGSFVSSAHGVPRSTNDIDIVIAPTPAQLAALLAQFQDAEFYSDRDDAFDALKHRSQFNIIDQKTFWKSTSLLAGMSRSTDHASRGAQLPRLRV